MAPHLPGAIWEGLEMGGAVEHREPSSNLQVVFCLGSSPCSKFLRSVQVLSVAGVVNGLGMCLAADMSVFG